MLLDSALQIVKLIVLRMEIIQQINVLQNVLRHIFQITLLTYAFYIVLKELTIMLILIQGHAF